MCSIANGNSGDITADQALGILSENGQAILIDVRTEPEWQYVGAPDLSSFGKDVVFLSWQVYPSMQTLPDFAERLNEILHNRGVEANAPLLFLCRSGARSRSAAIEMTKAGWGRCLNIADGFEGPLDADRKRGRVEGWKAKGLPWRQS